MTGDERAETPSDPQFHWSMATSFESLPLIIYCNSDAAESSGHRLFTKLPELEDSG